MAIVRSIAIGRARGSAGDITYTESKGRTIVRERRREGAPLSSPAQLSHQSRRNGLIAAWNYRLKNYSYLWTNLQPYVSPYTMFLKMNAPFSAEPWVVGTSWNVTPAGGYISWGIYDEYSVSITRTHTLGFYVHVHNRRIINDIRVGDRFVVMRRTSETSGTVSFITLNVTQQRLDSIKENAYFYADTSANYNLFAVSFHSVFYNRSSTGRWNIVPIT